MQEPNRTPLVKGMKLAKVLSGLLAASAEDIMKIAA